MKITLLHLLVFLLGLEYLFYDCHRLALEIIHGLLIGLGARRRIGGREHANRLLNFFQACGPASVGTKVNSLFEVPV